MRATRACLVLTVALVSACAAARPAGALGTGSVHIQGKGVRAHYLALDAIKTYG